MKEYRYSLDRTSKKYHCPRCTKKRFVRYVDNETGEYLPLEFGRCDRESECGYFQNPKGEFANTYEVKYTPPPPISYHPIELVKQSGRNFKQNNFIQFLKTLFSEDEVKDAILKYLIGTSKYWNGATVFWQIDNQQKIRHGKIMLYDPETGKRAKNADGKAYINSVRSTLKLKDFNLKQCLFGLHLINESETRTVAIVEGEKTAVIMSLFKPEYVWLATGSKQGFKYDMLKPLKSYKIIVFPDKSEFVDWQDKAMELKNFGFDISVSSYLENTDNPKGTDLADIFIDEVKVQNKPITSEKLKAKGIRTKAENIALKMAKINPVFQKLITEFDLTDTNGIQINLN
ncbi:DUF6371 domain-containing protein [Bizionia paragorgiae]|uniref:DUF6371 domain-containing protein n=1 Tax=Bizionia paragorgiae TaxID=283786 RepID=UPI003A8FCD8B